MSTVADQQNNAWDLIETAANAMGVSAEAQRKWRERAKVPHKHRLTVIQQLAAKGIFVGPDFFDHLPPIDTPQEVTQAAE